MWFIFKPCSTLLTSVFVFVLNCIQLPRLHQSSLRAADGSATYWEREYVCVCGLITVLVWTTDKRIIYPARDRRFVIGRRIRCIAFGVTSGLPASLHRRTYTCSVFVSLKLTLLLLQTDDTGVSGRAVKSWVCASVHGCVRLCQLSSLYVLWPVGFVFFVCVSCGKKSYGVMALYVLC